MGIIKAGRLQKLKCGSYKSEEQVQVQVPNSISYRRNSGRRGALSELTLVRGRSSVWTSTGWLIASAHTWTRDNGVYTCTAYTEKASSDHWPLEKPFASASPRSPTYYSFWPTHHCLFCSVSIAFCLFCCKSCGSQAKVIDDFTIGSRRVASVVFKHDAMYLEHLSRDTDTHPMRCSAVDVYRSRLHWEYSKRVITTMLSHLWPRSTPKGMPFTRIRVDERHRAG